MSLRRRESIKGRPTRPSPVPCSMFLRSSRAGARAFCNSGGALADRERLLARTSTNSGAGADLLAARACTFCEPRWLQLVATGRGSRRRRGGSTRCRGCPFPIGAHGKSGGGDPLRERTGATRERWGGLATAADASPQCRRIMQELLFARVRVYLIRTSFVLGDTGRTDRVRGSAEFGRRAASTCLVRIAAALSREAWRTLITF